MPAVIHASGGIIVVPLLVVDGYPHLGRVTIVKTFAAAVVIVSPEILRVIDVRVVLYM